jgi:hypothetical protein
MSKKIYYATKDYDIKISKNAKISKFNKKIGGDLRNERI